MTDTAPAVETADDATAGAGNDSDNTKSDFVAPSSQKELNRIIGERLAREREKFADYNDIKTTAEALADEKTTWDTAQAALTAERDEALARVAELETMTVRATVAAEHGIPAELITGTTREECDKQVEALAEHTKKLLSQNGQWGSAVGTTASATTGIDPLHQFMTQPKER